MRRDIGQASSELWRRYEEKKEAQRRYKRGTALCVGIAMCALIAVSLPTAFSLGGNNAVAESQAGDGNMFAGERQTLGGALDVPLRGGESKGSDVPLAPTGVLSLTAVGSESIPLSDEFSSELLCALGDVALYRTDGDAASTAATLVLSLEDGGRLELGITAERRFAVDGVLYRAENADTLLDLLADAGIKFAD